MAIVQARMGSSRLPGKVLMDIGGRPMLAHVVERAQAIEGVDHVVVATTTEAADDVLAEFCHSADWSFARGPERDVLHRYALAARWSRADLIVRLTADCPLLDPEVSALVLRKHRDAAAVFGARYTSNTIPTRTYPDGLDTEVFTREALDRAASEVTDFEDREHVTPWMRRRLMTYGVQFGVDLSALRWTVDTAEDLERVRKIYEALEPYIMTSRRWSMAATLRAHLRVEGKTLWATTR